MKRIIEKIKNKVEAIQRADEFTRRLWHYGLTGVTMFVVVTLWLGYENVTIPGVAPVEGYVAVPSFEPGVLDTFASGAGTIAKGTGTRLSRGIALLKELVGKRDIVVVKKFEAKPVKFVLDKLPDVPPAELP